MERALEVQDRRLRAGERRGGDAANATRVTPGGLIGLRPGEGHWIQTRPLPETTGPSPPLVGAFLQLTCPGVGGGQLDLCSSPGGLDPIPRRSSGRFLLLPTPVLGHTGSYCHLPAPTCPDGDRDDRPRLPREPG